MGYTNQVYPVSETDFKTKYLFPKRLCLHTCSSSPEIECPPFQEPPRWPASLKAPDLLAGELVAAQKIIQCANKRRAPAPLNVID